MARPRIMKDGARYNIYLGAEDDELLQELGNGNRSAGIRAALAFWRDRQTLTIPRHLRRGDD